ncbi:MAG: ribosome hibernation-promoting factor, HPF/YfiA family [Bdellovibrionia bacterium]
MKNNYTFKHIDPSQSLVEYTEDLLQSIGRFLLRDGQGQIYYSKFKGEFTVEISVNTKEKYFKASHSSDDPYAAVDSAIAKLEKQFIKNRKVLKNHKKHELSNEGYLESLNGQFEWNYRHYRKAA